MTASLPCMLHKMCQPSADLAENSENFEVQNTEPHGSLEIIKVSGFCLGKGSPVSGGHVVGGYRYA